MFDITSLVNHVIVEVCICALRSVTDQICKYVKTVCVYIGMHMCTFVCVCVCASGGGVQQEGDGCSCTACDREADAWKKKHIYLENW